LKVDTTEPEREAEGRPNETERGKEGADRAKINNSQDAGGPKANGPGGSVASQGRGRSQSHTSHSITRDGVTGKCQPTHKEEPSAHRII